MSEKKLITSYIPCGTLYKAGTLLTGLDNQVPVTGAKDHCEQIPIGPTVNGFALLQRASLA
jgi:hypothetical protein